MNISLLGVTAEKFIVSQKTDSGYFSYISFVPRLKAAPFANKEYIYMLDISYSMSGENLESAKKALKICLRNLEAGDIFNMIAFESSFECFSERGVELTEDSFKKANLWIDQQTSRGGTEIFPALRYAVESMKNEHDIEKIIMLLTDGQVGNEDEIIKYVKGNFDGRVFCVGIDVNVNDSFLNKVSTVGNGYTEFYYPDSNEDLAGKIVRQFARSNAAYLKDIKFKADCKIEVAGKPPKYLYSDECCNIILKSDDCIDFLRVIGSSDEGEMTLEFPVTDTNGNPELFSKMWAKKRITDYERDAFDINPRHEKLAKEKIIEISVMYGVICRYTSFIALNERESKQVNLPKAVAVPVNAPKRKAAKSSGGGILGRGLFSEMKMLSRPYSDDDTEDFVCYSRSPREQERRSQERLEMKRLMRPIDDADDFSEFMPRSASIPPPPPSAAYAPSASVQSSDADESDPFESIFRIFNRSSATRPQPEGKSKIQPLVLRFFKEISDRDTPVSESEFKLDIRAKIIELSKHCDAIDFAVCFNEMDQILSAVEQFVGKGDQAFDDSFQKLLQLLDENCRLNDASLKSADIASMQNFDGSFCQCSQLKKKYTLVAAKRFISDSDSFLYSRQIKKLVEFFRRTDATVLEDSCFAEYLK
ncbi:MAG: VWA domain-containing protein [Oscillospiraceae bacterium]|nr:VWA domain-containing protein [Oscillospiraceae bacterium]